MLNEVQLLFADLEVECGSTEPSRKYPLSFV